MMLIFLKDLSLKSFRGLMGIVSQDSILFNDSIFNNIKLGNTKAKREDVINAAKIANAHEFIMESKMDTIQILEINF